MKTRLAFQLDENEDVNRAAASRIRDVVVVEPGDAPDALVTSAPGATDTPSLLVGGDPGAAANLFPAFPWRFSPQVRAIRSSLDAGQLGKPGLLRMHVWSPASQPQGDDTKLAAVDLALWFTGERADAVHASHNPHASLIHLGFPGGAMAMLDFTGALPEGEGYRSLSLIGSRGAAYADDHRDRNLLFDGGAPAASAPGSDCAFIVPMLEEFITAVREGRSAVSAQQEYRNALELLRKATA